MQVGRVLAICMIMASGQLCLIRTLLSTGKIPLSVVVPVVGLKSKTPLLPRMFSVRRTRLSAQLFVLSIMLLVACILTAPTPNSTAIAKQTFVVTM